MSRDVAHIIGNGDHASMYKPSKGLKICCNLPPFPVDNVYTTCMVDFKMMVHIRKGEVTVPGDWTLGARPKKWTEMHSDFYMKHMHQIKGFYLILPKYVKNYTDFNCGHMAAHYTANQLKCKEIHMYGFDSLFDPNLRSFTDVYLNSDRSLNNNIRLNDNWRPIWAHMFKEFPDVKWKLYHSHSAIKIPIPDNVEIITK